MRKQCVLCFLLLLFAINTTAQKGLALSLTINNEISDTVFADEPVLFTITITNRAAQDAALWNLANSRRIAELQELMEKKKITPGQYEVEKRFLDSTRKKTETIYVGAKEKPWYTELEWDAVNDVTKSPVSFTPVLLPNPKTEPVAQLDENGYYKVVFGLSAEAIQKMTAGRLTLRVKLKEVNSGRVQMIVNGTSMPPGLAESETILLHKGNYYWHAGDATRTMSSADRILAKNPVSLEALILKGDGQVLQQSYLPALETYNKALKEYYRQYGTGGEPPEYLLSVIALVKKELGQ